MAGKRRISIRIDMTPMVDIAFLLLIFYMATTQFKPPEARAVELPSSHSQIELPDKGLINVTVTEHDSIYVDYTEIAEIEIDGQTIETTIRPGGFRDQQGSRQTAEVANRSQSRPTCLVRDNAGCDGYDEGEPPGALPYHHRS